MVLQYVLLYFNVRDQWNPHDENQEEDLKKIQEIYKGIIPFVLLQLCGLILVMWKPNVSLWLMKAAYDY